MKILLDTNIIIHREASKIVNQDIGQLFNWIDKLHYEKCVHPLTVEELKKHLDKETVKTMHIKLESYNVLHTTAPLEPSIKEFIENSDKNENDINDSKLLNELINKRVDILITEDKNIHTKSLTLKIKDKVFSINSFLENVLSKYPELVDYKVLAIKKERFGNIDSTDEFFDSFRADYDGFDDWFRKKAEDFAYVCYYDNKLRAFLYLKVEDEKESYNDIEPRFYKKKRLKIGTFKVTLYGFKLGERFLKIVFDNALVQKVKEIYFTIFDNRPDRKILINLTEAFGFIFHGIKKANLKEERVYVRDFGGMVCKKDPMLTFPYISITNDIYFICIYPKYHTELFPDSILRTESPLDFIENEPHRNAISKVYISHAYERNLKPSDIIIFYRTGGLYKGVVTTIGIVESILKSFKDEKDFIRKSRGKTVLKEKELKEYWNYYPTFAPFLINFLYCYSLPKRPTLKDLINIGVFSSPTSIPRGISKISKENFNKIIKISKTDESIIIH